MPLGDRGDSSIRSLGLSLDQNPTYRKTMEDEHMIIEKFCGTKDLGYFAVYDGHGGVIAAQYVKDHLHENVLKLLKQESNIPKADIRKILHQAFIDTDAELVKKGEKSGSTAAVAIIRHSSSGNTIFTANCGDARIVLNKNGTGIALTKDHKSSDREEIDRVVKAGGLMIQGKVGGALAVSRAFGDSELKKWLTVEPYLLQTQLNQTDTQLIVACDGLWDVCSNQEAVDLIKNEKDAQRASDKLLNYALSHGTRDNVSIVVLFL